MIKPIVKDVLFLSQKSVEATPMDKAVADDLRDTLNAHKNECIGMAANMIGVRKNIIIVNMGFMNIIMYNPKIVSKKGEYKTSEGCLSLVGERPTTRYSEIVVQYQDEGFNKREERFTDLTAQIIQHEIDHLNGIII